MGMECINGKKTEKFILGTGKTVNGQVLGIFCIRTTKSFLGFLKTTKDTESGSQFRLMDQKDMECGKMENIRKSLQFYTKPKIK